MNTRKEPGAFQRRLDKKVIEKEIKGALSRAVELLTANYPAGRVPQLQKSTQAEIIESTLNRLVVDKKIAALKPLHEYRVDRETLATSVVYTGCEKHRWKTYQQAVPGEPTEMITYCDDCGAEYGYDDVEPPEREFPAEEP